MSDIVQLRCVLSAKQDKVRTCGVHTKRKFETNAQK